MIIINSRSFTFGMGTGIIIFSLIAFLVYSFDYKNRITLESKVVTELSEEQIISSARKLGMIYVNELPEKKEETLITEKVESIPKEEPNKTKQPEEVEEVEEEVEISDLQKEIDSREINPSIEINISEGFSSKDISSLLKKNGIIDNIDEFESYVSKKGVSRKLFYGKFYFEKNMNYEDIVNILSRI